GEVLAEVESLELETLQLDILTARNDIRIAEKLVAELTKLSDAGAVAGQDVLEAEAKLGQARNALAVARSKWLALDLTAERLEDLLREGKPLAGLTLPVTAPVSGTVIHTELAAGRVVEPADHLAEVTDLSTVWVRIGVLEKDLGRVRVGGMVELHIGNHAPLVRPVTAISPYLDPSTNLASAWVELANPSGSAPVFQ